MVHKGREIYHKQVGVGIHNEPAIAIVRHKKKKYCNLATGCLCCEHNGSLTRYFRNGKTGQAGGKDHRGWDEKERADRTNTKGTPGGGGKSVPRPKPSRQNPAAS